METSDKEQGKKKVTEVRTFSVPFPLGENKDNITITTNTPSKLSREQIINHAIHFHVEGNIPKAIKYYQQIINQGCNNHIIFYNYALILKNLGKLKEAEILLRKAIELKLDFAEAYSNLGNILRDLGKLEEAELSTRKAIELKPDYYDAHYNLGILLNDLGKSQEAEFSYRKAIEINPNYANAHSNLGNILRDLGNLQEARLCSEKIMSLRSWSILGSYSFNREMKLD